MLDNDLCLARGGGRSRCLAWSRREAPPSRQAQPTLKSGTSRNASLLKTRAGGYTEAAKATLDKIVADVQAAIDAKKRR